MPQPAAAVASPAPRQTIGAILSRLSLRQTTVLAAALGVAAAALVIAPLAILHRPMESRSHTAQLSADQTSATEVPAHTLHRSYKRLTAKAAPVTPTSDPVLVSAEIIAASSLTTTPEPAATPLPTVINTADLTDPHKKDLAMQLVSSAENSSLNWRAQYAYIQDIGDGRGYTGGIIGFTSGTHDMLELVQYYAQLAPGNALAKYVPALKAVDGSDSHAGLGAVFVADWKSAAADPKFQAAQDHERDTVYFDPAVAQAKADGLHALGQFIYYDAIVMHGPGTDHVSFGGIRATAMARAKTPAQGGDETTYLDAYLDARKAAMLTEAAHDDTSRVDTEQRLFLNLGNLYLNPPLSWKTYGDSYAITQ